MAYRISTYEKEFGEEQKEKLSFDEFFDRLSSRYYAKHGWITSGLLWYKNPGMHHEVFKRIVRINYNNKWHKGKFKPWKNKYLVVKTNKGRKMLIPREKVYFKGKSRNLKYIIRYPLGDCDNVTTTHLHILGDTKEYEKAYDKWKNKQNAKSNKS
jgi:hypothetical protein